MSANRKISAFSALARSSTTLGDVKIQSFEEMPKNGNSHLFCYISQTAQPIFKPKVIGYLHPKTILNFIIQSLLTNSTQIFEHRRIVDRGRFDPNRLIQCITTRNIEKCNKTTPKIICASNITSIDSLLSLTATKQQKIHGYTRTEAYRFIVELCRSVS